MTQEKTFTISVECTSGDGEPHQHQIEVAAAHSYAYGFRKESPVEMQYTCPRSCKDQMVTFNTKPEFSRPYRIVGVT